MIGCGNRKRGKPMMKPTPGRCVILAACYRWRFDAELVRVSPAHLRLHCELNQECLSSARVYSQ